MAAYVRSGGWVAGVVVGGIGMHSQGRTLAEARRNMSAVVADMLVIAPHQFPKGVRRAPRGAIYVDQFTVIR